MGSLLAQIFPACSRRFDVPAAAGSWQHGESSQRFDPHSGDVMSAGPLLVRENPAIHSLRLAQQRHLGEPEWPFVVIPWMDQSMKGHQSIRAFSNSEPSLYYFTIQTV